MITEYLNYLKNIAGYSYNTLQAYRNDLSSFATWMKSFNPEARWSTITQADIERYISYLSEQGYQPTSTNRALATIRSIYRFWQRNGLISHNPAKGVIRKIEPKRVPTTISKTDIAAAYSASNGDTKIMIALLYITGMRLGELLSMTWDDISPADGTIKVHGKGSKERLIYVPAGIINLLQEKQNGKRYHGAIFPYGQRTCRRMIKIAFDTIGSHEACNPHSFRHTIATQWAADGANTATISKALGHSRLETSQKYIDLAHMPLKSMMASVNMFH